MNWIERMYELKGKDFYSQNGEGLYLEYIHKCLNYSCERKSFIDIGAGDGFTLSNTRHLSNIGWPGKHLDKLNGETITKDNILFFYNNPYLISIDIDGNDYWILDTMLSHYQSPIVIAEFNADFTDARTIKYNPDHVWAGDDYYGFSFDAGVKLAEKHGYKVIFQIADMNMIMVRQDLITVPVPEVTFKSNNYFKKSERTDWIFI